MDRIETPTLIVGAGPVGLMGAILLARQGRPVLVVDRRPGPIRQPAAHVVNARTFEICRQAGVDMDALAQGSMDPADGGLTVFVTDLVGEEIGRLPFERQDDGCLRDTPTPLRNLSQNRFEPILLDTLAKLPSAEVRYSQEWQRAEQDEDGVTSVLRDLEGGAEYEIRSDVLLGCDGAGSRVRKSLDIELQGPPKLESFVMIHFEADLRPLVADRPGALYWILDPEVGGALVAHDIEGDPAWVYMNPFDSDAESPEDYDEARCLALVQRAIGRDDVPVRIVERGNWTMSAQVADGMRRGRIFLAGDSAHRFPPTGGLGLNSGVQDVHDLVWRLGATADGWAPSALLDSYERERLPVAQNNADQSLRNALKMVQVPQALGITEERTRARMEATLADPAARAAVVTAIENQAEHFDMLGLQIGFAYAEGTLVPDGSEPPALENPVREYRASSRPGARLPHAWLERDGERISSLDLIDYEGFTLLSWGEDTDWGAAAAAAAGVPLAHVRIGTDANEPDDHWAEVCGLERGGALLVRPDQHVAWRAISRPEDPKGALSAALAALLAPRP